MYNKELLTFVHQAYGRERRQRCTVNRV